MKLDITLILHGSSMTLNCIIFDCNRHNTKIWNHLVKSGFRNILILICRSIQNRKYNVLTFKFLHWWLCLHKILSMQVMILFYMRLKWMLIFYPCVDRFDPRDPHLHRYYRNQYKRPGSGRPSEYRQHVKGKKTFLFGECYNL